MSGAGWTTVRVGGWSGERLVPLHPAVPGDLDHRVRDGLEARLVLAVAGCCPCGAVVPALSANQRRRWRVGTQPLRMEVGHLDDCPAPDPAVDEVLAQAAARAGAGRPS